jgi:hypothetical protein
MNQITAFFEVRHTLKLHEIQSQIDPDRAQKPKPNKHKPGAPNPNRPNPNRLEIQKALRMLSLKAAADSLGCGSGCSCAPRLKKVQQQG